MLDSYEKSKLNSSKKFDHCEETFPTRLKLNRHIKVVHLKLKKSKQKFICEKCMTDFIQNGVLEDTMRRKVSKDVVIDRMVFVRHTNVIITRHKSNLERHKNGVHLKLINFNCDNFAFSQISFHQCSSLQNIKNRYVSCNYITPRKINLKRQINRIHKKLKVYKARYTLEIFARDIAIKR